MSCLSSILNSFSFLLASISPNLKKLFSRFRVPDGCDLVAAAALPVAFGTSHVALIHRAQLISAQVPSQLQLQLQDASLLSSQMLKLRF